MATVSYNHELTNESLYLTVITLSPLSNLYLCYTITLILTNLLLPLLVYFLDYYQLD